MIRIALFAVALITPVVATAIPAQFTHQGRLTDSAGTPIEGPHTVTIRLYSAPTGGMADWTEQHTNIPFSGGYFSVPIGTVGPDPLDETVLTGAAKYLSVQVDTGDELGPRVPLTTVPYALRAGIADNAASLSLLAGITRACPNGVTQTFDGTDWSACPTTWNCTSEPQHVGCPAAPPSSDYASCGDIVADPAFNGTQDLLYWIDPDGPNTGADPHPAYCLMSAAGGGWTKVLNIDTSDGNHVDYTNSAFWTGTATNLAAPSGHATQDFKDGEAFDHVQGSEILIQVHQEGTPIAWRVWSLSPAATMNDIGGSAQNTTITSATTSSSNTATLDVYEAVVRNPGQLRANWTYGYSTSLDQARLVNDQAAAFSAPNNNDDTVAGLGTRMNINNGTPGSWWDAGYGWASNGYQIARMGSDEVQPDPWATSNSRALEYDYAIFLR